MKSLYIITFFSEGSEGIGEAVSELTSSLMAAELKHVRALSLEMNSGIPEEEVRRYVEPIVKAVLDAHERKATT